MMLIHGRLATTILLFTLLAGLWGVIAALRRRPVEPGYWGIVVVGEILFLVQGVLGLLLYLGGERPARGVHIVYGVFMVLALPGLYAITRGRDDRRAQWAYSLMFLLLSVISLRAMVTAG